MKPKNDTKILFFSLVITSGLIGIALTGFTNLFEVKLEGSEPLNPNQISLGEKILVTADTNHDKQAGMQEFASSNFITAVTKFQLSLRANRNDPEALIYLNNAIVERKVIAANQKTFKIAVSVPIGSNLNVTKEILRGVAQAQDEVNRRGGINGSLLRVAIANDENNPTLAKKIAVQFVKDTSILAVVGHNASDASVAAAPVYEKGGLVMISPTSFSQKLSGSGKYIFRTVPNIRFVADTLSRYTIKSDRKTNIAVCSDSLAPDNQSFTNEFISAMFSDGGKFINIGCDFSAPDFNPSAVISQSISAGADGLLLAPHVDRIDLAINVAKANNKKLTLFGSPTLYTYKTLQSGQADVNGMVLAVPWHPAAIPGNSFPSNAAKLWGGAVNWRTAMAYDATQAIIAGLRQNNNTRDGLQKTLSSPNFRVNGVTGTIQFLPSGDRNGSAILVKVQPSDRSGTGYEFVALNP